MGPAARAAAFFDLDRTLMAGSSGLHFVRAAYAQGMISRRRLAGDSWGALKFRLRGSTDAGTEKVRARIIGTLVHELRRRGGGLGCAAICSGGGQGDALIVEVNGSK